MALLFEIIFYFSYYTLHSKTNLVLAYPLASFFYTVNFIRVAAAQDELTRTQ